MRMETVRWWRRFSDEADFIGLLGERAVDLQQKDANIADDLFIVGRTLAKKEIDPYAAAEELAAGLFR